MDKNSVVQALAALAHPVRLDAFRALVVTGREGLAQKTLAEVVGVGPTNLAFHLKELTAAGLVTQAHAGRFVIYRAAFEQMNDLLAFMTKNCCQGLSASPAESADSMTSPDACGC
jgi:DNA-binding transcriptional ArsR family regulator